jgi:hypothetical protein
MTRYSAGYRTSGAGTATLPMASLYATTVGRPKLLEVGVFNTTATALNVALARFTTAGTSTAITTGGPEDDESQTAVATPRNTHSGTAPTLGSILRYASLGAAIGSGIIWTFGGGDSSGLVIPASLAQGVGLYTPQGTGQICDVYWVWSA